LISSTGPAGFWIVRTALTPSPSGFADATVIACSFFARGGHAGAQLHARARALDGERAEVEIGIRTHDFRLRIDLTRLHRQLHARLDAAAGRHHLAAGDADRGTQLAHLARHQRALHAADVLPDLLGDLLRRDDSGGRWRRGPEAGRTRKYHAAPATTTTPASANPTSPPDPLRLRAALFGLPRSPATCRTRPAFRDP
jgi:hypothetical protein